MNKGKEQKISTEKKTLRETSDRTLKGPYQEGVHWDFGPRFESKGYGYNKSKSEISRYDLEDTRFFSQIYYQHDDNVKIFTDEEVAELNRKEAEENEEALKEALADGFIEIPITFRDSNGVLVDKRAWVHPSFRPSNTPNFYEDFGMRYNIYIPTYKRAKGNATATLLDEFGIKNWYFAMDPSQYSEYKKYWPIEKFILRDISFRDPSMIDLGTSLKRPNYMSGTAGIYNNLLSFSRSLGEKKYWTMDDDFKNMGLKAYKGDKPASTKLPYYKDDYYRASVLTKELGFDFIHFMDEIEKVGEATRNHGFLGLEKWGMVYNNPISWKLGTRVYSFYLSDNMTQLKHKYCMNNDVIASFEQAKRMMPPFLFEGISYNSMPTQAGGGLTEQYKILGTLEKGKVLVKAHPSISKISEIFSRIHHSADFSLNTKLRPVGTAKDRDKQPYYYKADD